MGKPRSENKIKFTVIFGTEACRYALEEGLEATINALNSSKLSEGSYHTYYLDTKDDVEEMKRALNDAWGWDASYWDE